MGGRCGVVYETVSDRLAVVEVVMKTMASILVVLGIEAAVFIKATALACTSLPAEARDRVEAMAARLFTDEGEVQ